MRENLPYLLFLVLPWDHSVEDESEAEGGHLAKVVRHPHVLGQALVAVPEVDEHDLVLVGGGIGVPLEPPLGRPEDGGSVPQVITVESNTGFA